MFKHLKHQKIKKKIKNMEKELTLVFVNDEFGDIKSGDMVVNKQGIISIVEVCDSKKIKDKIPTKPYLISKTDMLPKNEDCFVFNSYTKKVERYFSTEELRCEGIYKVVGLPAQIICPIGCDCHKWLEDINIIKQKEGKCTVDIVNEKLRNVNNTIIINL